MSETQQMPPMKIAFVIDGEVVDVLHTDERLAAIFLSDPKIIDVTDKYAGQDPNFNLFKWKYDGTNFTNAE